MKDENETVLKLRCVLIQNNEILKYSEFLIKTFIS